MIKNIASLYLLQIVSYIFPLLMTPYLARTLGVADFGILAVCNAVVAYFTLLVSWGFDLSASQQISQCSDDAQKMRAIFWNTLLAKLTLGLISFFVLIVLTLAIPSLRADWPVMAASSLAIFASMFGVNWFLQGLEKMGAFALTSLIGRLISIVLTFCFVHSPHDTALAAGISAAAAVVSGAASIWTATNFARLTPIHFSLSGAFDQLRHGARLFLSQAAISLYTYTNVLVVGMYCGNQQAGFFDGADRVKRISLSLISPLGNAMYPRINSMVARTEHRVAKTMLGLLALQGSITFVMAATVFTFAPECSKFLLGKSYEQSIPLIRTLSPNIFLIGVSNVLGINMMLPFGMKNIFTTIIVAAGIINILLLLLLTPRFGAIGAAQAVTITEAIVTALQVFALVKNRQFFYRNAP